MRAPAKLGQNFNCRNQRGHPTAPSDAGRYTLDATKQER